MSGIKDVSTDISKRIEMKPSDRLLIINSETNQFQYLEADNLTKKSTSESYNARAIAAENNILGALAEKANAVDVNSPLNILFSDLSGNTYTNIIFANQTVAIFYKNPTALDKATATFNSVGVLTLPFTAVSGFTAVLIGTTGALGNFASGVDFDELNKNVTGQFVTVGATTVDASYNFELSNSLTVFNKKPITISGFINQIQFNCVKVGVILFRLIRNNYDGTYTLYNQFTYTASSLGINNLVAGIDFPKIEVTEGDYLGAYFTTATGSIGTKALSSAAFRLSASMTIGVPVGSEVNTSYEMGLNCIVESYSLKRSIDNVSDVVFGDDLLIKNSDLSFSSSGFNIYGTGVIKNNTLVNSTGNIASATGWKTLTIPIKPGMTKLYVNRITVNFSSAFYTFSPVPTLQADRVYGNSKALLEVGEFSVNIPSWAVEFNIDIAAPLDTTDAGYKNCYIGYDTEAFLNRIKGAAVNGSGSSGASDYSTMIKSIPHTWNAVGHSIWYQDGKTFSTPNPDNPDAGKLGVGIQTLVKNHIKFTGYNNYGYSGRSLAGSSLSDITSILQQKSTWVAGKIWSYDSITNDHKLNRPIGSTSDFLNNTGITTYYGSLRILHDTIKALSPDYIMICASPLQKVNGTYTSFSVNTAGHTMEDYVTALQWVRNRLGWRFVDQFKDSGFNMENILLNTWDGLHPINGSKENPIGYYRYYGLWLSEFYKLL